MMKAMTLKKLVVRKQPENNHDRRIQRRKHPVVPCRKSENLPGTYHLTVFLASTLIHLNHADNIIQTCRKPSDIDPSGKDPKPTDMETSSLKETGPTAGDRPSDEQPVTDNVDPSNEPPTGSQSAEAGVGSNQEPPTGNQLDTEQNKDIPEAETRADNPPKKDANTDPGSSSPSKIQGPTRPRPEIITGEYILQT
jgi:hypothetical protein